MRKLKNYGTNLVALALLLVAANSAADKLADIDRLLEVSGTNAQMALLQGQFADGLRQGVSQSGGPNAFADELIGKMGELNGATIVANMRSKLMDQLTQADVATLNAWYTTDLADKITALEVAGSSAEAANQINQNLDSLLSNSERVGMARRIDEVLRGGELMLTMMKSIQVTMVNAMMAQAPPEQRRQVLAQIDQQLNLAMPQLTEITLASYVSTYSSLSDVELSAYLDFLSKPAAQKFYQTSTQSIGDTIGAVLADSFADKAN